MAVATRANVVSSFTLIKGTMIEETYAVFRDWDLARSKKENLDRLRDENYIGVRSAAWLRDVGKVLNRRFDPSGADRALVVLAKASMPAAEWNPILLWHMTRDEFLLRDFLVNWLYPEFEGGVLRPRPEDVATFLKSMADRGGVTEHEWSPTTGDRVVAGLMRAAADFGLLTGSVVKQFTSFHLPERSFLYVVHALGESYANAGQLVHAKDWRMFLMDPGAVERELVRLHQYRKLSYESAGTLGQLTLPYATAIAYAEAC
jgi:Putative inner membrane protein (DUF1819)